MLRKADVRLGQEIDTYEKKRKKQQEEYEKQQANQPTGIKGYFKNLINTDKLKEISSDGFQAKDILDYGKLAAKTSVEGAKSIGRGILSTGENIGDYAAYHTANALQKAGIAEDYMEEVKRATTDNLTRQILAPTNDSLLGTSGQSTLEGVGNSLSNMAIGGVLGTGATYGSMFLSSAGGATTNKYAEIDKTLQQLQFQKQLATGEEKQRLQAEIDDLSKNKDKYINTYATISGLAEMGSEAMFGGIAKGLKIRGIGTGAEDDLIRYATKNISNMLARNLISAGISATGEGIEEIMSDFGEALAEKASTEKDTPFIELLADQDWLGDFMNGFMSSLITQGGETIKASRSGIDITTGLTQTESDVVKELAKEQQAKDGGKLSDIERDIENKLKEGTIKYEDIQRVLSKDTYNELDALKGKQRRISELESRIKELDKNPNEKLTSLNEYNSTKEELNQLKNEDYSRIDELTERLENETNELTKGKDGNISGAFAQSYLDRQNRGVAYQVDEDTYNKASKELQGLYDSAKRIMNNTVQSRKFIDSMAKLSKSNGLNYQMTNNQELKELGKTVDGKVVNGLGYRTENGNTILINVDSADNLNTILGHETTHFTETAGNYKDYQKFLQKNFKDEYDSLKEKYESIYEGLDADIDSEITAQLTGEKLFNDPKFIEKLTEKPTLFNKIKNFIDDLVTKFTGTKEEKQLKDLQKRFQEVYDKTDFSKKTEIKHSLLEDNQDSSNNEVNDYVKEKGYTFKNNGILEVNNLTDKQIKDLVKIYKTTGYEDVSTDYLIDRLKSGQMPLQREIADRFIEKELGHKPQYDTTKIFEDSEGNQLTQEQVEFFKDSDVRDIRGRLIPVYHRTNADFTVFDPNAGTQHGKKYGKGLYFSIVPENYGNNTIKAYLNAKEGEYKYIPKMGYYIVQEPNQIKRTDNLNPTSNPDIRYSLSEDAETFTTPYGVQVVKNPSQDDYIEMRKEILDERPWLRGEAILRHTYDEQGNEYYWSAYDAQHADVEPYINQRYNTRTYQGDGWWKNPFYKDMPRDYSYMNNTKYSLSQDSEGKSLNEDQKEFFKNVSPEVIDKNGNLMRFYHGSNSQFTVFDITKGSQSNSNAGVGFWFTPNREGARNFAESVWYGDKTPTTFEVYLDMKNPKVYETYDNTDVRNNLKEQLNEVYNERRQLTDKYSWETPSLSNLISYMSYMDDAKLAENLKNNFRFSEEKAQQYLEDARKYIELNNQYKEIEKQFDDARWTDSYEQFRTDIYKIAGKSADDANTGGTGMALDNKEQVLADYVNSLKEQGYDGIVIKNTVYDSNTMGGTNDQYVVFEPNQIKNVDNLHPTSNPDIRYSLTDDKGRNLTQDQQIFYSNSVVRDKEGNLKTYYNGSDNFNIFNRNFMSDSSKWGKGIYLTEHEDIAKNYGKDLKEVYVNITNPLNERRKTITFDQYNALYQRLYDGEEAYREEYDMYDNDLDLLWDMTNKGSWADYAEIIKETTGKDGLIIDRMDDVEDMIIAFQSNQVKRVSNLTPTEDPDIRYSLQNQNEQLAPYNPNGIYGRDVRLENQQVRQDIDTLRDVNEVAPTTQTIDRDTPRPLTEEEANRLYEEQGWNEDLIAPVRNNLTQEESNELDTLEDMERAGIETNEDIERRNELYRKETPVDEELDTTTSLDEIRDYADVGKRNVKAYQYEHPEVKPFFQEEARRMLSDLNNSIKAEKFAIPDNNKNIEDWTWVGIKRQTSPEIEELLDGYRGYKYTYDEIRKGLEAIIKDHGNENIAVAKRLEFYLDERLREGYDAYGVLDDNGEQYHVQRNQDYLNFLREQEWNNYYESIPRAALDEIAPTRDTILNADIERDIAPTSLVVDTQPVPEGKGRSSYWQNVGKQDFLTDESKELIQDEDDVKYYDVVSNKETLSKAYDKLRTGGTSEVLNWNNKFQLDEKGKVKSKVTAEDVAEGWILMKQYQDDGNYDAMIQVAKTMRNMGTEAGQAVQAFNIMSRMTPEGMVKYAQSELTEAFDKASKNKSKQWIDMNEGNFDLTPDETRYIIDTMNEVQNMEDGYEKKVKLAQIQALISNKLPTNLGNEIKSWMRISMLFNPKTQVRNVAGNAVIVPVNAAADIFSSAIDRFLARKTGVRTTGTFNVKAALEGLKRGAYEATNDYKLGINTKDVNMNRFEVGQGKSFTEKTILGKTLNNTESLLNYVMDLGDRVFSEAVFENSLQNQMELNNTTEITQEMLDIARTEALQRTWNDNNNYTKFVLDIRKALNKVNFKGYGLGDVLIPFAKTPANLTKAIVDYSPVGLVNSIVKGKNLKNAIETGKFTAQQQHEFVQTLGKATAGTLLYVLGYALAKAGISTGKSDDDKDVSNFMKNTLGISSYSINVGGKSYTYDWAQPIAAPFSITANIVSSKNSEEALAESIIANLDTAGSILMEQSFLQSLNETLNNNDGVVNGLLQQALDLPARAIPTLSKQIADLTDDTQRQTYEYNEPIKTAINKMKSKIPGLSEDLAPVVDTMGREVKKYGGKNNLFNVFLNPANVNTENISSSAQEIYDLYKSTGDKTIMPRTAPYYVNKKGEKIVLNSTQKAEYQRISGSMIESQVQDLMNNTQYINMSDEEKASIVKKIVDYSYNIAQHDVLGTEISQTYQTVYLYSKVGNVNDWYLLKSQEFTSDKNSEGKTISGSLKNKVVNYVNEMDISAIDKVMLIELNGYRLSDYDMEVYNYINSMDLSYDDKLALLKKMGVIQ